MASLIDIVTVTFNSGEVFDRWVARLTPDIDGNFDFFVVDSGSDAPHIDSVRSAVRRVQSERWHFLGLDVNLGYGRCSNIGAHQGTSPWLAFINPDLEIDLRRLVLLVESADSCGREIIGPRIVRSVDQLSGSVASLSSSYGIHDAFPVSGACLLIKRDLFETLGGFDPRFFMFQEEIDLEARAVRDFGIRPGICTVVEAVSAGAGSSEGVSSSWAFVERDAAHVVRAMKDRGVFIFALDFVYRTWRAFGVGHGHRLTAVRQLWQSVWVSRRRTREYESILRRIRSGDFLWEQF